METQPRPTELTIRRRHPDDVPQLTELLWEQQPTSRYPFRTPLPIPVERFLHADDAAGAWVAEAGGEPVGHICHIGPAYGFADAERMNEACAAAHGCAVEELSWISALFVGLAARRSGAGRRLLTAAVDDIRAIERHPCLEVLPYDPSALRLYDATGWREVLRLRPDWLVEAAGSAGPDVVVMAHRLRGSAT